MDISLNNGKEGILPSFFLTENPNENPLGFILDSLSIILKNRFQESERYRIINTKSRINIACPYCGDSHRDIRKKRGNIYTDTYLYKCYNCSKTTSIKRFLEDWNINIDGWKSFFNNIYSLSIKNHSNVSSGINILDLKSLKGFTIECIIKTYKLYPPTIDIKNYLINRGQIVDLRFWYEPKSNCIFILNIINGMVFGAIRRFLDSNAINKYTIINYQQLLKWNSIEHGDTENLISNIWGLDTINISIPINIFEGPLDSFLCPNSLAVSGIKDCPYNFTTNRWIYDNDKTGKTAAIDRCNNGETVFLWTKYLSENNIIGIKDYTDLWIYCKSKDIKIPNIENYFSQSQYDIYDI